MARETVYRYVGAIVLCMALTAGINACDMGDEETILTIPLTAEAEINVSDTLLPYTQTDSVDLLRNSSYKDYRERFRDAAVQYMTLRITEYQGLPDGDSTEFASVECSLKFDATYKDDTEYPIGKMDTVKVKNLKAVHIPVTNPKIHDIIDNIQYRSRFTLITKYTLKNGTSGTIEGMKGSLSLNMLLKAAVL